MAVPSAHTYGPWSKLALPIRQPRPFRMGPFFYAMAPGRDDGEEQSDDFNLWLGLRGGCSVRMLGRTLELQAGRVVLIPPGVRVRQVTGPDQELEMACVHFDVRVAGRLIRDAGRHVDAAGLRLTLPGLPTLALVAEVDAVAMGERLRRIRGRPQDDLSHLMLVSALVEVFRLLREAHLGLTSSLDEQRLEQASLFLEANLGRRVTIAEASRRAGVSTETLGRIFRAHYGMSPMPYLLHLRMARAREMLQSRQPTVSEVAFACGFSTPQYFSRAFRKAFGMSPRAFRESLPLIP